MFTNSISAKDLTVTNEQKDNLESNLNNSQNEDDSLSTILPRSAWNSQLAYLRVLFKAKKALDRIEKEAGIFRNSP